MHCLKCERTITTWRQALIFKAVRRPTTSWVNAEKISQENYYIWCHRMSDFNAKVYQSRFPLGVRPRPPRGAYSGRGGGFPIQLVTLDRAVKEGKGERRAMRGAWVGASRQFFFRYKHCNDQTQNCTYSTVVLLLAISGAMAQPPILRLVADCLHNKSYNKLHIIMFCTLSCHVKMP